MRASAKPSRLRPLAARTACFVLLPLVVASVVATACSGPPQPLPPTTGTPAGGSSDASTLTILYTSDEHGWIEPYQADGVRRGGVSQLLAQLVRHEGHCAGAFPGLPAPSCQQASTVLLSGGDNLIGPAISGFYRGDTMAQAMRRLGYAAAAFGNHELDFGHDQYRRNRAQAGFPYLAANLVREDGGTQDFTKPYVLIQRGEVTLGVVGLSTVTTPLTAAATRFVGLRFESPKTALDRVVPQVWEAGADAVVLLVHECHDLVAPMVLQNPQWDLSFVGTGHCHRTSVEVLNGVPVIGPDWRLGHYARVRLDVDPSLPPHDRAQVVDYELVEVASPLDAPAPTVDPDLDRRIAKWKAKIDSVLGEVVGYSQVGLARKSTALGQWIVRAWLTRFEADLALTTLGAIRQDLPPGPISRETIASIMPFENELVVCQATGAQLAEMLKDQEAVIAGFVRRGDGTIVDPQGNPLDPERRYRVVTTDFLFDGGDGYTFHRFDPKPERTGVSWRTPVVEWTKKAGSSAARPLESLLHAAHE